MARHLLLETICQSAIGSGFVNPQYYLGMCTLTLSASVPAFMPAECMGSICPSATSAQYAIFITGLYLVALGTGGIKPCVSSFGADQFDDTDPGKRIKKGFFFNWFSFSISIGALLSSSSIILVASSHKFNLDAPHDSTLLFETPEEFSAIKGSRKLVHADELK
ncbi:transporter [Lithospermum erythrorhizon]|uniref:Transporter n=1 Tax=Lithospermum erythrorhizon TaxID=34254 RepID=A0AAV3Q5U9_LITER